MESNYEEADQSDQESHNLGIGRSYECVFCKRGFTTAQALGGHMNIHRKDRAKSKPTPATSNKHEENYHGGPRFYQPISSYPPHYAAPNESQLRYRTFFPTSTSSARQFYGNNHHDNLQDCYQQNFDCIGDDCRMSLSLQYSSTLVEDVKKKASAERRENDLDLELRLGPHDP